MTIRFKTGDRVRAKFIKHGVSTTFIGDIEEIYPNGDPCLHVLKIEEGFNLPTRVIIAAKDVKEVL